MSTTLPDTLTLRTVQKADLHAILDVVNENMVYHYGEPDYDEAFLLEDWARSGFDVEKDAWVVVTEAGVIIGYATLCKEQGEAFVHPSYLQQGVRTYLFDVMEAERIKRAVSEAETKEVKMLAWANGLTEEEPHFFEERGYHVIRVFWRMLIDLIETPEAPVVPEGYVIRPFQAGEERDVHRVLTEAFSQHWGINQATFEEWYARQQLVNFDKTLWLVAEQDGEIVGAATCMTHLENGGFVRSLGVLSSARGSGVGMALLKQAFVNFHQRGKTYVVLGVDSENTTGATRLYERAGMRVVRRFVRYEKQLSAE